MIHFIKGLNYDSNIYIVTGETPTIIDCGTGLWHDYVMKKIEKILDPCKIKQIVLTHEHYDHCGGVKLIHEKTGNKSIVIAHVDASDKIENGDSAFAQMLGGFMPKMPVNLKLVDGDKIILGDDEYKVIHTPGHTPGCICLYNKKSGSIFTGDTVFSNGSFGRYDFPGGDPRLLRESIEKLAQLEIINMYPGHESIVEGDGHEHMEMVLRNIEYLI